MKNNVEYIDLQSKIVIITDLKFKNYATKLLFFWDIVQSSWHCQLEFSKRSTGIFHKVPTKTLLHGIHLSMSRNVIWTIWFCVRIFKVMNFPLGETVKRLIIWTCWENKRNPNRSNSSLSSCIMELMIEHCDFCGYGLILWLVIYAIELIYGQEFHFKKK